MVMKPANFKGTNKDHKIYVGRSTTVHNYCFVLYSHTLVELRSPHISIGYNKCYCSSSSDLLCFVHGQGQKSEQKHRTKNFPKLYNDLPLLTMTRGTDLS